MIEMKKGASQNYSFVVKAESGNHLLNSISFPNKEKAREAVRLLQTFKKDGSTFERKTNHSGKFLFSLKSNKGELIGNSLLYQSEAGMENGIKNLINRIVSLSSLNQL